MKEKEALELLEKLRYLENREIPKDGEGLNKFVIVPLTYVRNNNIELDLSELWKKRYDYRKAFPLDLDYSIVRVIRAEYSIYSADFDSKKFERMFN